MNIDQFWTIVDRVHAAAPDNMDRKCKLLKAELIQLPLAEVQSFDRIFTELFFNAYSWDLWGAIVLIKSGCSDDSFMDFRSTLISMGKRVYESALENPDFLADISFSAPTFEGYQYVASKVIEELQKVHGFTDEQIEEGQKAQGAAPLHPRTPRGQPLEDWAMEPRYPKLCAKYGHKDSQYVRAKESAEMLRKHREKAAHLADILLDSGVIPSCGLVPPFGVVRKVLRGERPLGTEYQTVFSEPIEVSEGEYWSALRLLKKPTEEQLGRRPDLVGKKIQLDPDRVHDDDYGLWIQSLKDRRLLE